MPSRYQRQFDAEQVSAHANIVGRRNSSDVHLELCPAFGEDTGAHDVQWLCVVTDDRPGLLSLICSAILAHSLDIVSARVYCRDRSDGKREAVDFLSVRPLKQTTESKHELDVDSIERSIADLLAGETELEAIRRQAAPTPPPPSAALEERIDVAFSAEEPDVLVVRAKNRSGLLLATTLAMFRECVTIVRSEVTTQGAVTRNEFQVSEFDGSPLSDARRKGVSERLRAVLNKK